MPEYKFHLNGKALTHDADGERSLLDVLREDLGLTGTKYGCGEGACRACTVLMDGKPVQACLTSISEVDGHGIETIEGLSSDGQLHPVQQAFLKHEAMQCGYCVPGMIMRAVGFLRANPGPASRERIIEAMNGNLCRCCGYENLMSALEEASKGERA